MKYSDDIIDFTDLADDISYKANNMLISNIFDEVIILKDMRFEDVKDWVKNIKSGDKVFCYSSKLNKVNTDKAKILDYIFDKLSKIKCIEFWMNDTFTKDKKDYYNLLKEYDFMPKTVFSKKEALEKLNFPVVAKPIDGSNGVGIEKFDTKKDLESNKSNFGLYCEYVEHKNEFRVYVLDGKVIYIIERIKLHQNKYNIDVKKKDERIEFAYIPQEIKGFPYLKKVQSVAGKISKELKGHVNSIYSIDMLVTPDLKIKVIESNSKSQVGPLTFIEFCENLFEIPYHTRKLMDDTKNLFLKEELRKNKNLIEKSLNPISYKTKDVDKEFTKYLETFKSKEIITKNKKV